ncbi:MAG: hypothetical protein IJK53_00460 [Erysipelotrichaceae bacterium]|nr:hypothetical protein [Erysipelotrichaceae bacterium]
MAKTFEIVKRRNLVTGEERAVKFTYGADELSKRRILRKLKNSISGKEGQIYEYRYDESMYMHLLPGLSPETVKELSSRMYSTAYAVCKKKHKGEEVLYLSLFKDSALRFKASIPAASRWEKGKEVLNPDFYVKELRLCL